jgi:DNA-binding beta-propeller fold protein YncE
VNPYGLAIDPTGKFLCVTSDDTSGSVSVYAIDPITGEITAIEGSPFAAGKNPEGIVAVAAH